MTWNEIDRDHETHTGSTSLFFTSIPRSFLKEGKTFYVCLLLIIKYFLLSVDDSFTIFVCDSKLETDCLRYQRQLRSKGLPKDSKIRRLKPEENRYTYKGRLRIFVENLHQLNEYGLPGPHKRRETGH